MEQRTFLPPGADGHTLGIDTISQRLAQGLDPRGRGDALLERLVDGDDVPGRLTLTHPLTPAAVLVALVDRADGMGVLLTQRTDHLSHHPGQISFPGGRLEEADGDDPVQGALRETQEEVGLDPALVRVLGRLDQYITGTGFAVTPVVGVVTPPFTITADPFEVADVFEIPLSFVLNAENHQLHRRHVAGRSRPFWSLTWQDRVVWGATAGILVNLCDVLTGSRHDPR